MKILVVGSFEYKMYAEALYRAFVNLKEDVSFFDLHSFDYEGNNIFSQLLNRFQNRFLVGPKISKINNCLLKKVKQEYPDLVFLYNAVPIFAKTVKNIQACGSIVFLYSNDDPFSKIPSEKYWRHYKQSAFISNHNFVYREKNRIDFKKIGINNTSVLKSYYIKERNYPIECKKILDVIFAGHFENDGRDKHIKALIDANINITVFGDEAWQEAPLYNEIKFVAKNYLKISKDYNDTLNSAKIAVVFLSKINSDTYTRRCFEIPATKTLMLCEYTDDMAAMFEPDREAVYFKNTEELVLKCKYLLKNEKKIIEIAENGYNKVISVGHSIDDRAREILEKYNDIRYKI